MDWLHLTLLAAVVAAWWPRRTRGSGRVTVAEWRGMLAARRGHKREGRAC